MMRMNEATYDKVVEILQSGDNNLKTCGMLAEECESAEGYKIDDGLHCHLCATGLIAWNLDPEGFKLHYPRTCLPPEVLGSLGIPAELDQILWRLNDSPTGFTFQQIAAVVQALRGAGTIKVREEA